MILIGMFDSPFVRRVAVSAKLLGLDFDHRNWSIGSDFDRIRQYNPLGRVPTLVLDDGEVLVESSAILDYLDERAGAERALLPRSGADRRRSLQLMALATGAAEKGVLQLYEHAFRPEDRRHAPWIERCASQMTSALAELEKAFEGLGEHWFLGRRISQADVTAVCVFSFLRSALALDAMPYPGLQRLAARCESMPEFRATHLAFFAPQAAAS